MFSVFFVGKKIFCRSPSRGTLQHNRRFIPQRISSSFVTLLFPVSRLLPALPPVLPALNLKIFILKCFCLPSRLFAFFAVKNAFPSFAFLFLPSPVPPI